MPKLLSLPREYEKIFSVSDRPGILLISRCLKFGIGRQGLMCFIIVSVLSRATVPPVPFCTSRDKRVLVMRYNSLSEAKLL